MESIKIISISYVHDPEAALKWGKLYIDLLVEQMKKDKKLYVGSYNEDG